MSVAWKLTLTVFGESVFSIANLEIRGATESVLSSIGLRSGVVGLKKF